MHAANFCCRSLIRMAIVSSRVALLHPRKSIYTSRRCMCVCVSVSAHINSVCVLHSHRHSHTVVLASWTHLLAFDMAYLFGYLLLRISLSLSLSLFSLCHSLPGSALCRNRSDDRHSERLFCEWLRQVFM